MIRFITNIIISRAKNSTQSGQEKYEQYFLKTKLYTKYKEKVDALLIASGYENCITNK